MLEAYRPLLDEMRRDRNRWPELAYCPVRRPERRVEDRHYRKRFGVLACLQYDLREDDEDLVRYLFEQDVQEQKNSWGGSKALNLGAYVLAAFRRPGDIPLFWQAKLANFDTFCGFDPRYLVWLQPDGILEPPSDHPSASDVVKTVAEMIAYHAQELAVWWKEQQRKFPSREADEDPLTLAERALILGQHDEGRRWLDAWERQAPPSDRTLSTLLHFRSAMGQHEEALAVAEQRLALAAGDPWKEVSARQQLAEYTLKAGHLRRAWEAIGACWRAIAGNAKWREMGIERMIIELMFGLSLAAADEDEPLARVAFLSARERFADSKMPLVMLRKAGAAAQRLGMAETASHYDGLAERERKRIEEKFPPKSD
jgi:hypothetical protein